MKSLPLVCLSTALVLGSLLLPAHSSTSVLQSGSHCVAYKTRKTLAMMAQSDIVGINCNPTVRAVKAANGTLSAEISVPISGFNSKEAERDKEVSRILKAGSQPSLFIKTVSLSAAQWQTMLKKGGGNVKATIKIGGAVYPVSSATKISRVNGQLEVSGVITTKFSAFGIKPPEVGPGGVIAKAPDYLELHYNLISGKVQNLKVVPGL